MNQTKDMTDAFVTVSDRAAMDPANIDSFFGPLARSSELQAQIDDLAAKVAERVTHSLFSYPADSTPELRALIEAIVTRVPSSPANSFSPH